MHMHSVDLDVLQGKLVSFLESYFSPEISKRISEVIMWAELHNKQGQGLLKLLGSEPLQEVLPIGDLKITDKTSVSSLIDANKQPSFYVAQIATDIAIEKATGNGFAIVGANGMYSGTGALGFYAERIAAQDLIGIVMARSPGAVAPFNTKTPLFGTNPLAVAFPSMERPLVFDMATSAITWYELVLAKLKGTAIPENVAIDKLGKSTIDPAEAMGGAILPFDQSHKGSGLSMFVEIMSGPLVSASYCDHETFDKDWGLVVLALSPVLLSNTAEFKEAVSNLTRTIRQQEPLSGNMVRLPGDASRQHAEHVLATQRLAVDEDVLRLLSIDIPNAPEATRKPFPTNACDL